MNKYDKKARDLESVSRAAMFSVGVTTTAESGFCTTAREIAAYLEQMAETVPPWKFWIKPGLRLAAALIRGIMALKRCPK